MRAQGIVEALRDIEAAQSEPLREILISHVIHSEEEGGDPAVGDALMEAYAAVRRSEMEEKEKEMLTVVGEDAHQWLIQHYVYGHNDALPGRSREYILEGFMWPDSGLSWTRDKSFPKQFLGFLGYAMGYREGKRTKAMMRYYAEEQEKRKEAEKNEQST